MNIGKEKEIKNKPRTKPAQKPIEVPNWPIRKPVEVEK